MTPTKKGAPAALTRPKEVKKPAQLLTGFSAVDSPGAATESKTDRSKAAILSAEEFLAAIPDDGPLPDGWAILYMLIFQNGKRYVGMTTRSLKRRVRGHRTTAIRNQRRSCHALYNAIRCYGHDSFWAIEIERGPVDHISFPGDWKRVTNKMMDEFYAANPHLQEEK